MSKPPTMKAGIAAWAASLCVVALAGCGGLSANQPSLTTQTAAAKWHGVGYAKSATGNVIGVIDKSDNAQTGRLVTTLANGLATSADVELDGTMEGGTRVPKGDNLKVDPANTANFSNNDSFLGRALAGSSYNVVQYRTRSGTTDFIAYGSHGTLTGNMPSGGSFAYAGKAVGSAYGSATGQAEIAGDVRIDATFQPGGGNVSGRISNLNGPLQGVDILLNQKTISGNSYANGQLSLVAAGGNTPVANLTGADYQGSFFGTGAAETAGTFQLGAQAVPMVGGGAQRVEAVGGFGAGR